KMILIVWACETGKNQAQQISTSIYDALNSTTDEQIKDELKQFSLQILHCNNTFSVKGLAIDAKFLVRIIGSITTYVMMIFQFEFIYLMISKNTMVTTGLTNDSFSYVFLHED
ncbi:PREDICTED: uncharacterized protein LOC108693531, partial [Atta colombica]|uniref:uncharacterized protein LOC108693531 n=1 Tax=Atta colombica TaxID=520822 RepID=UPI00084C178E